MSSIAPRPKAQLTRALRLFGGRLIVVLVVLAIGLTIAPALDAAPRKRSKSTKKRQTRRRTAKKTRRQPKRRAKKSAKRGTARPRKPKGKKSKRRVTKAKRNKTGSKRARKQATAAKAAAKRAKQQKKRFARQLRRCKSRKQRKTRHCKKILAQHRQFLSREKKRLAARAKARQIARMQRKCKSRRHRKSKACRVFISAQRRKRMYRRICGRRYGRARRRDTVSRFSRRHRISEGVFRRLNKFSRGNRLRRGRRYLVYRSPWEGQRLHRGVLLKALSGVISMQRPARGWGKQLAVEAIRKGAQIVQRNTPLASHLVVGDLSKKGGGCLPPHRSHRGGLDADIGYYMQGGAQRAWLSLARPETIDADRTWQLLAAFLATGRLQYAFIDYGLQVPLYDAAIRAGRTPQSLRHVFQYPRSRGAVKSGIIRHLKGHADHMHVRFTCPPQSACAIDDETMKRLERLQQQRHGGGRSHRLSSAGKFKRRAVGKVRRSQILPHGW